MKLLHLSLLTSMAFACQGPAAEESGATKAVTSSAAATAASSNNESDSSEGVIGPDEAFFAGVYLESVFNASRTNPHPVLEVSTGVSLKSSQVEAFDFAANLQPKRLDLMSRILLKLGDKDNDENLSFDEFTALKLSPDLKGASGSAISHAYDKDLFDAAAGDDALLSADEIQVLLSEVADESELSKLSKAESRKKLVSNWETVLKAYDSNSDGKLSLEEQAKLRADRAIILSRFAAE